MAHTTPVYVEIDHRPTWCPNRGPDVIDKQLKEIDKIATKFPPKDAYGQGIHERLDAAKAYYADLRTRMIADR